MLFFSGESKVNRVCGKNPTVHKHFKLKYEGRVPQPPTTTATQEAENHKDAVHSDNFYRSLHYVLIDVDSDPGACVKQE